MFKKIKLSTNTQIFRSQTVESPLFLDFRLKKLIFLCADVLHFLSRSSVTSDGISALAPGRNNADPAGATEGGGEVRIKKSGDVVAPGPSKTGNMWSKKSMILDEKSRSHMHVIHELNGI